MTDPKDAAQQHLNTLPLKPGDQFRHYKGGEYEIVTLALKEDTLEPMVIYQSLIHGTIWARTYEDWNQKVKVKGQKIPRFQKI